MEPVHEPRQLRDGVLTKQQTRPVAPLWGVAGRFRVYGRKAINLLKGDPQPHG